MEQTPTVAPIRNLYQRMAAIMAEVEKVEKTGKNEHFRYNFIEQSMVMAAFRPKMAEHGVILLPEILEAATSSDGKNSFKTIDMRFTLINADDPTDRISAIWKGEGQDNMDKGVSKAATSAQKTFLMKLFLVSDRDDPDGDDTEPAPPRQAAKPQAAKPAVAKPTQPSAQPATQPAAQGAPQQVPTLAQWKTWSKADQEAALKEKSAITTLCNMLGHPVPDGWDAIAKLGPQYHLPVRDSKDVTLEYLGVLRVKMENAYKGAAPAPLLEAPAESEKYPF